VTEGSRRAVIAAFLANLGIAVAKFAAFLATGAASMLAESVHSVADASNQGLLVLGTARARREPTPEHLFGFGTERYFWAFVVALVLAFLGVGLAWWLEAPHFDALGSISIGVLLAVIAAVLAVEMQSLLVGDAASPRDRDAVRAAVEGAPGVRRMLHLRTLHLGPDDLLIAVKAEFEAALDVAGVAEAVDSVERRVRAASGEGTHAD